MKMTMINSSSKGLIHKKLLNLHTTASKDTGAPLRPPPPPVTRIVAVAHSMVTLLSRVHVTKHNVSVYVTVRQQQLLHTVKVYAGRGSGLRIAVGRGPGPWIDLFVSNGRIKLFNMRVVVSTAAFHARVRGSVPGLISLKETKMFLPHPLVKLSIAGSLRDREVACSVSDSQGSNFESCVCRAVSSHLSHHPQKVLLDQFNL